MTANHTILVSIADPFQGSVDGARLGLLAERVLNAEGTPPCELSVTVTDDETVRALNRVYAGEDAVTDVLSFSQREGETLVGPPGGPPPLGEVIIAYPQAVRQAKGGVDGEIDWLVVHGVLHLLGYDHEDPEQGKRMRAREEELLAG